MREIIGFLVMSIVSVVDPLLLPALFLGYRFHSYSKAVAVGAVNGIAAILLFAVIFDKSPYLEITMAKTLAGIFVASVSFGVGYLRRRKMSQPEEQEAKQGVEV